MSTVTPFPEPDDWSGLNSIFKANRELQERIRAMNARPVQEMQRTIREANRRPLQELQRTIREANRRPLQEMQRTIREMNQRPWKEMQRAISEINRPPYQEFQRAIREMNRQPMRDLQETLRGFNTRALADFSVFASSHGGAFAAAAASLAAEAGSAAELAGEALPDDEAPGWFAKLPITAQVGLLVAILHALDEFGKFLADVANADVPDEMRSATQTLFAVVIVLMMVIELRTKPPDA